MLVLYFYSNILLIRYHYFVIVKSNYSTFMAVFTSCFDKKFEHKNLLVPLSLSCATLPHATM